MKWTMKTPCADCPFRKEGGIRLTRRRIQDIAGMMLDVSGGVFPCHRTVDYDEDDGLPKDDGQVHCAGALIFAEKNDTATQMMRIMERCGEYDHRRFDDDDKALVFDNLKQMKATAIR